MKYIFIGGVPRSGTTLVQKILSAHPKISAGPEFDYLPDVSLLYSKMKAGVNDGRQSMYYTHESLRSVFRSLLDNLFQKRVNEETEFISEKTPSNLLVFDQLISLVGDEKFIFVLRDPRGIIASMKEVYQRAKRNKADVKVGKDLYTDILLIFKYYINALKVINKHPEKIFIIVYEDLLREPEKQIKGLCNFLNVDFILEMLDTKKENEISLLMENPTISAWYNKEMYDRKISKDGIDKWKNTLSNFESSIVEHFFNNQNFFFLDRYNLRKQTMFIQLSLLMLKVKNRFSKKVEY